MVVRLHARVDEGTTAGLTSGATSALAPFELRLSSTPVWDAASPV